MKTEKLRGYLKNAISNKIRVLIKGKPGIGKSDLVAQVCDELKAQLVLMHPAICDPTDFKGMPAITKGGKEAEFLPFGDLARLIKAKGLTVCLVDDIGQSAPAVQAALMQFLLARELNGIRISDDVVFVGCTNDTKDMAGVSGMITPLKSRWESIVTLEEDLDSWCNWAIGKGLPVEVISFLRFKPALLCDFKPNKEIENFPCPRTWASLAKNMQAGVQDIEVFEGAVGPGAAKEFYAYLQLCNKLPNLDAILMNPKTAELVEQPSVMFAVATGLARKATPNNIGAIIEYTNRLGQREFQALCLKDAVMINKDICNAAAFTQWCAVHGSKLLA
jgi:hypothetical protein